MNLELNVVRFENEDVIATSDWSQKSYRALDANYLGVDSDWNQYNEICTAFYGEGNNNGLLAGDHGYNILDGQVKQSELGDVFTADEYYHIDKDSLFNNDECAYIFKTCTDPTHHYNQN